jgi:hypothetical protein
MLVPSTHTHTARLRMPHHVSVDPLMVQHASKNADACADSNRFIDVESVDGRHAGAGGCDGRTAAVSCDGCCTAAVSRLLLLLCALGGRCPGCRAPGAPPGASPVIAEGAHVPLGQPNVRQARRRPRGRRLCGVQPIEVQGPAVCVCVLVWWQRPGQDGWLAHLLQAPHRAQHTQAGTPRATGGRQPTIGTCRACSGCQWGVPGRLEL